jgi:hypothetical protein
MFDLNDYMSEVYEIAAKQSCTAVHAVSLLVENLNTMKEHHEGSGRLNYHTLGQLWSKLDYATKNQQKATAVQVATENPTSAQQTVVERRATRRRS